MPSVSEGLSVEGQPMHDLNGEGDFDAAMAAQIEKQRQPVAPESADGQSQRELLASGAAITERLLEDDGRLSTSIAAGLTTGSPSPRTETREEIIERSRQAVEGPEYDAIREQWAWEEL